MLRTSSERPDPRSRRATRGEKRASRYVRIGQAPPRGQGPSREGQTVPGCDAGEQELRNLVQVGAGRGNVGGWLEKHLGATQVPRRRVGEDLVQELVRRPQQQVRVLAPTGVQLPGGATALTRDRPVIVAVGERHRRMTGRNADPVQWPGRPVEPDEGGQRRVGGDEPRQLADLARADLVPEVDDLSLLGFAGEERGVGQHPVRLCSVPPGRGGRPGRRRAASGRSPACCRAAAACAPAPGRLRSRSAARSVAHVRAAVSRPPGPGGAAVLWPGRR